MTGELTPHEVLADLLGSGDFPAEVIDPEAAARIIIKRLQDAGFKIVPAAWTAEAALDEIVELIDEGKFGGEYLIGMIEGIAKHGPTRQGGQP